jgi:hypothetical protein
MKTICEYQELVTGLAAFVGLLVFCVAAITGVFPQ